MTSMFWGVKLETGKKYSQSVKAPYHLTMAALDPHGEGKAKREPVSVILKENKQEFIICSLDYEKQYQQPLDLVLQQEEEVTYFTKGEGTVYLTGYYLPPDDFDDFESSEESEEDEKDSVDMSTAITNAMKRKAEALPVSMVKQQPKKAKPTVETAGSPKFDKEKQKQDSKEVKKGVEAKNIPIKVEKGKADKQAIKKDDDESEEDDSEEDMDDSDDFEDLMGPALDDDDDDDDDDEDEDENESEESDSGISKMKKLGDKATGKQGGKPNGDVKLNTPPSGTKPQFDKSPKSDGKQFTNKSFGGKKDWQQGKQNFKPGGFQQKKPWTPNQQNRNSNPNSKGSPFQYNQKGDGSGFKGKNKFQHNKPKPWNSAKK